MTSYYPEGRLIATPENQRCLSSLAALKEAKESKKILEARTYICDKDHNLIVDLNGIKGIIPRAEGAIGIAEGTVRDIALISRVNKPVCFQITSLEKDQNGVPYVLLSRKAVQLRCMNDYISKLQPGDILNAAITHLDSFGCFADIGCGICALIPIDFISVSRISHPSDRFRVGDSIRAAVKSTEGGRVLLTHKELLGTWEENAALFKTGETVSGIVRSIEKYGVFIELTPNLAGLAEPFPEAKTGQTASVFIKSILPEKMKIKLILVDVSDEERALPEIKYFKNSEHISRWLYSPENSQKHIETIF